MKLCFQVIGLCVTMSPPQRYNKKNNHNQLQPLPQPQSQLHQQSPNSQPAHHSPPLLPPTPTSIPTTPIHLYPTGAAAIIPAPPTYELIPNRIFVGGFPLSTTESDLREHFDRFFPVKDVKMIKTLDGQSKGYGFVTFETEDEAEEVRQLNPKQLEFRSRKLNLGPAIRKMNSSAFPPGYAIATPNQMLPPAPGAFGYALPSPPMPYGGYPYPAASPMFVYPPPPTPDQSNYFGYPPNTSHFFPN
uniref:RRM domain-containing protein n=1 Tax=Caenorhabditis tropicalis TaxID=1561998 RepID=A0A1I7TSR9_9PELO